MAEGLYVPLVPLQGERDEEEGGEDLSEVEEEHVYSPNGTDVNVLLARAGSPKENAPALDIKSRYLYFSRFIPNFIGSSFCSWAVEHKFVANAEQAAQLGQFLLERKYIKAVAGLRRNEFRNDWIFYTFCVVDHSELFMQLTARQRNYLHKGKARHVKEHHTWLDVPISTLTVALGTAGVAGFWSTMSREWPGNGLEYVGYAFSILSATVWSFVTLLYAGKMIFQFKKFWGEWNNPIAMNMYPVWSMTLLSLAVTCLSVNSLLAEALWWVGTPVQLLFALVISTRWMLRTRQLQEMTPHMFLPVVGLSLVPIAGGPLRFLELGYLFFGVSFIFWIVLFTVLLHRLFFVGRLPPKLVPSMFLAIAPPSLIGLAWYGLNNEMGSVGRSIFGMSTFFLAMLFFFRILLTSIPFSLAWWAYTFPFAAYGSLAVRYHQALSVGISDTVGNLPTFVLVIAVAALVNLTWLSVFLFTIVYVIRRQLFWPFGKRYVAPLERGNTVTDMNGRPA